MNKYIGFDIDCNKIVACVVESGQKDIYQTLRPDIGSMRKFLNEQKQHGYRVELVFEISGQAGYIYDSLIDCVDDIKVANPSKMTWIYRTAKKNDRIDARKQAVLLSMNELPRAHMPCEGVREWRSMTRLRATCLQAQPAFLTSLFGDCRNRWETRGLS